MDASALMTEGPPRASGSRPRSGGANASGTWDSCFSVCANTPYDTPSERACDGGDLRGLEYRTSRPYYLHTYSSGGAEARLRSCGEGGSLQVQLRPAAA